MGAILDSPTNVFIAREDVLDSRARRGSRAVPAGRTSSHRHWRAQRGEALLHIALGHATGTPAGAWSTGRTAAGRPIVAGGPRKSMQISLAHSGPFLVAATSACGPVAVDLEVIRERRYREIARYLGWPERTWADGIAANAFFHLWTLWETTIKLDSATSVIAQPALFASFARKVDAGEPCVVRISDRIARSWFCPDHFWMTVLAGSDDEMRLFYLEAWPSEKLGALLEEVDPYHGQLPAPSVVSRKSAR